MKYHIAWICYLKRTYLFAALVLQNLLTFQNTTIQWQNRGESNWCYRLKNIAQWKWPIPYYTVIFGKCNRTFWITWVFSVTKVQEFYKFTCPFKQKWASSFQRMFHGKVEWDVPLTSILGVNWSVWTRYKCLHHHALVAVACTTCKHNTTTSDSSLASGI